MSGASKRRQSSSEDEGGGASWMDTYGDLVTLLLCFFVLLFAFSSVDAKKWEALVGAFSGTTAVVIEELTPESAMSMPIDMIERSENEEVITVDKATYEQMQQDKDAFMELYENISEYVNEHDISVDMEVDWDSYKVTMRFDDSVLFNSGEAALLDSAHPILEHIINLLEQQDRLIQLVDVQGHTDTDPIRNARYRDNMDLSTARADVVGRYLMSSERIDVTKLSFRGLGEYHPVVDNDTEENKAFNRRVDVVLEAYRTNIPGV